jgi:hypothetical protein
VALGSNDIFWGSNASWWLRKMVENFVNEYSIFTINFIDKYSLCTTSFVNECSICTTQFCRQILHLYNQFCKRVLNLYDQFCRQILNLYGPIWTRIWKLYDPFWVRYLPFPYDPSNIKLFYFTNDISRSTSEGLCVSDISRRRTRNRRSNYIHDC